MKLALGILLLVALVVSGCRHGDPAPFEDFTLPPAEAGPGPNAFRDYVAAAEEAELKGSAYVHRVSFTPAQKDRIRDLLAGAMRRVSSAGNRPCRFAYEPVEPFEAPPYRQGWRLIGRAIAWHITALIEKGDFAGAVQWAGVGMRFGFDLTGGAATDMSLGYAIVDDVRRALLPAIDRLDARQLQRLAELVVMALRRQPSVESSLENERRNMRQAVQALQNAYQSNDLKRFREKLGSDIAPAIRYFEELRAADARKRPAFFRGLAAEADLRVEHAAARFTMNARQRAEAPAFEPPPGERPWRRWALAFFRGLDGVVAIRDRTLARTRLLGLLAWQRAALRRTGAYHASVSAAPEPLRLDPFTGRPFVMHVAGRNLKLYSVGADFTDDGGETDESFESPDLRLETLTQ